MIPFMANRLVEINILQGKGAGISYNPALFWIKTLAFELKPNIVIAYPNLRFPPLGLNLVKTMGEVISWIWSALVESMKTVTTPINPVLLLGIGQQHNLLCIFLPRVQQYGEQKQH